MATAGPQPKLTEEQHAAIGTRGVSIALSAGAGCGKTFVLTERFLSHLAPSAPGAKPPADLGQMIAFTYTERAAREMRDRIRRKCEQRLRSAPDSEAAHWLDLLRGLDRARVSTVHSFCTSLLRGHAVEAGLDPTFSVIEPAQAQTLICELVDDELRRRLEAEDPQVIELATAFGLASLRGRIMALLASREKRLFSDFTSLDTDQLLAKWDRYAQQAMARLATGFAHGRPAQAVLDLLAEGDIDRQYDPKVEERRQALLTLIPTLGESVHPLDDLKTINEQAKTKGISAPKYWPDPDFKAQYKQAVESVRDETKKLIESCDINPAASRAAAATGLQLLTITAAVADEYQQEKRQRAMLDFDDLLACSHALLTSPGQASLRAELAGNIELLLVDESQDTDRLQVDLIDALCDGQPTGGKLFFVGDFKQSIYRFLGAEPSVFQSLRQRTPEQGRLPLSRNFRSQPSILNFTNALFCDEFDDLYEPLRAHRPQQTPEPAIELLLPTVSGNSREKGATERVRRREADWIARRIAGMLRNEERIVVDDDSAADNKPLRAVRPGDIAILFRTLSNVQYYEEALRELGVPYYLVGGKAFYSQQEVFDLINLLKCLVSPADEVSLIGVLRSPFFSFTDETLFWLAGDGRSMTLALFDNRLPSRISPTQQSAVRFAAQTIGELRACKDRMPIASLINRALERTGYDAVLLAEFLGERKLANLRKLINMARQFDRGGILTLADFVVQLSQFVADQPDEALAATHPETSNVVRLMTIHQSKGLEFPLVIVADIDRRSRSNSEAAHFDGQLGPLVSLPESSGATAYDVFKQENRQQDLAESTRLFYVALTRAADYLILSGGRSEKTDPQSSWMKLLDRRFDLTGGQCTAALPDGYANPQVAVITEQPYADLKRSKSGKRRDLGKLAQVALTPGIAASPDSLSVAAPIEPDFLARRQFSFSRLSGEVHSHHAPAADDDSLAAAASAPATGDPLGLGTLVHEVLAGISFGQPTDVASLARRHAAAQSIDSVEDISTAIELVERFLTSPTAARLAAAEQVHAELEFLFSWPVDRSPQAPAGERPLLQGFIDCLYQDTPGRWHLLDYKTNRVTSSNISQVAAGYEMQMLLYGLACEKILGTPPASLTLHFLRPGLEQTFTWDEAARRRVVELVNQGLAAAKTDQSKPEV